MKNSLRNLTVAIVVSAASITLSGVGCAQQAPSSLGAFDPNQLRDTFLRQAGFDPNGLGVNASSETAVVNPVPEFTTLVLPSFLRSETLGLQPDQGLLITSVLPASRAEKAGLQPGMLIVELDGQPMTFRTKMPQPCVGYQLVVLTEQGLVRVDVPPQIKERSIEEVTANAYSRVRTDASLTRKPLPRSLSVSEANGVMAVAAVVDDTTGPVKVELRGTRRELDHQLKSYSAEVQRILRPQIGL